MLVFFAAIGLICVAIIVNRNRDLKKLAPSKIVEGPAWLNEETRKWVASLDPRRCTPRFKQYDYATDEEEQVIDRFRTVITATAQSALDLLLIFPALSDILREIDDPVTRMAVYMAYRQRLRPVSEWVPEVSQQQWDMLLDCIETVVVCENRPPLPDISVFCAEMRDQNIENCLAKM